MYTLRCILTVLFTLLVISKQAGASGFTIYEFGAREQAKASAVAAQVENPSAIFYNPAGIAGLEGVQTQIGTSALFPKITFRSNVTGLKTEAEPGPIFLTYLFVSKDLAPRLGIGFGLFSASGNKVEYPSNWEGRFFLTKAELKQLNFAPTIAYKISENLSFGFSTVLTYADFEQTSQLDLSALGFSQEGSLALGGNGLGVHVAVGLKANAGPALLFGAVYKSPMKITFEGDASFQVPGLIGPLFPDGGIETVQRFPQMVIIGLANRSVTKLTVEVNLQWTNWDILNSQTIDFESNTPAVQDMVLPYNWRDTWTVRIGGQYDVNDAMAIRGGYIFDPAAVRDTTISPLLPELNKHIITTGLDIQKGGWIVNLYYAAILGEARQVDNALPGMPVHRGEYDSVAHVGGLSINYRY